MTLREAGWGCFLVGLPVAPFFERRLDPWHGHSWWAHGWLAVLWGLTWWYPHKPTAINRPLGAWVAWTLLWTWWTWYHHVMQVHRYPVGMLFPLLQALSLVVFYHAATQTWSARYLQHLCTGLAAVSVVILVYGVAQLTNHDPFFKSIDKGVMTDTLVGTIGNPMHLAAYLALTLPLLLLQGWWWAVAFNLAILACTHSIGGQLAAVAGLIWWCAWQDRRILKWVVAGLALCGGSVLWQHGDTFNPHGRWQVWQAFLAYGQPHPWTGLGLGAIFELSTRITDKAHPLFQWRHVHQEFFQVALEQGIVGLGLLLWAVGDLGRLVRRLPKTPLVIALSGVLVAFFVNCLTNFTMHLWMLAAMGLTAYTGLYVLEQEAHG